MPGKKPEAPAPKISNTSLPPHESPKDPDHDEWKVDEADDESFPASDPSSVTQPSKERPRAKKRG